MPSSDYTALAAAATPQNLVYNGSSRPLLFGAVRNTFGYRSWSLSVNINFKLDYYFRRPSVSYGTDQGLSQQSGDYAPPLAKAPVMNGTPLCPRCRPPPISSGINFL